MRFIILLAAWSLISQTSTAQLQSDNTFHHCGFDPMHRSKIQEEEQYEDGIKSFDTKWQFFTSTHRKNQYTLPVVVHIIHNNGSENISDQQVQTAIDHLNNAFANIGYYDQQVGVNTDIQFCLAKRTPDNTETTGITRTISTLTNFNSDTEDQEVKDLIRWDPTLYINIWVVNEICSSTGCGVAGYAYFPAAHGQSFDGIVVESAFMGDSEAGTSVLIHELGHYLGLYHTFQGGCPNNNCRSEGDQVCDTPPDQTTVRTACEDQINSCETDEDDSSSNNPFRSTASGGLGDQNDQFHNYMDYSRFECYNRFTQGQKERMIYSIENERNSLPHSPACLSPCPNPVSAQISANSTSFLVGETITLQGITDNAVSYNWYIDGVSFSTNQNTDYTFTEKGTFEIIFEAFSGDSNCLSGSDTILVDVMCSAVVDLTYDIDGTDIVLTNLSSNFNSIEWTLTEQNGPQVASSNSSTFSYSFSASGWYEICLSAITDLCSSDTCFFIRIYAEENELCGNGIDDDGDGWVDYFDEDCPENDSLFMAQPEVLCNAIWDIEDFSMELKWKSPESVPLWFDANIRTGDIDSDGEIEVLVKRPRSIFDLMALDGKTGQIKRNIHLPGSSTGNNYCMADIDHDGNVEFFYLSFERDGTFLYASHLSGAPLWQQQIIPPGRTRETYGAINIADFNQDGIPEVYSGGQIFNATNGALLAKGTMGLGMSEFTVLSVAADIFPDVPGLELAGGNTVYQVNITNLNGLSGNTLTPIIVPGNRPDGYTGVADFDADGLLDVVVVEGVGVVHSAQTDKMVYVWNPRTRTVMAEISNMVTKTSFPYIGDLNGDCIPEIGVPYGKRGGPGEQIGELMIFAYRNNPVLDIMYSVETTDNSGASGVTSFDFNQDGIQELIYRDQTTLRIMDGRTGESLTTKTVHSATGYELPVMADIDQDNQAELIVTGGIDTINYDYQKNLIYVYETDKLPWAPARSVWNQPAYHVTNINDDLTVPINQQNTASIRDQYCNCPNPYNYYMAQASYLSRSGCPNNPAFDAQIEIKDVRCSPEYITIEYVLSNLADKKAIPDSLVIGIYDGNPLAGPAQAVTFISPIIPIDPGKSSPILTIQLPLSSFQGNLYILANTLEGAITPFSMPVSCLYECDYDNNIDSVALFIDQVSIDLGPDIILCSNQVIPLEVPEGYTSYLWNDGTTEPYYTAYEAGIHWVEVSNICGQIIRDSIEIFIDPITQVEILADSFYCRGDTIRLNANGLFDEYRWFGLDPQYCDDCEEISILAQEDLQLILRVANNDNCFSSDSINIEIRDTSLVFEDYYICPGDSIWVANTWIKEEGVHIIIMDSSSDCDSTIIATVSVSGAGMAFDLGRDTTLCRQDSLYLSVGNNFQEYTWQDGSQSPEFIVNEPGTYWLQALDNCNFLHTDTIEVAFADTSVSFQNFILCQGDSLYYDNTWLTTAGTYRYNYSSSFDCDSTVIIQLVYDTINYSHQYELFCDPPQINMSISSSDSISVLWPNGEEGLDRILYNGGELNLRIESKSSSCQEDLIINLPFLPNLVDIPGSFDTTTLIGTELYLDLGLDTDSWSINWTPEQAVNCPNCSSIIIEEGYSGQLKAELQHIESGCIYEIQININTSDGVFIPNSFSPNNDGNNDLWEIHFSNSIAAVEMVLVYNRWGDQVLEWRGNGPFAWDGNFNGKRAEKGVYAYYVQLKTQQGNIISKKGDLTLMR